MARAKRTNRADARRRYRAVAAHSNFYSDCRFRIVAKGLDFGRSFPLSSIARGLAALSMRKYEKHFAFVFPANSIWFHLQIVK